MSDIKMTGEIQALLENQIADQYKGIIAQVFKDRDVFESKLKSTEELLERRTSDLDSSRLTGTKLSKEVSELKDTLQERTEQLTEAKQQASQYLELKLRSEMADEVVANNFKTLSMVFGTPEVQKTIHGQVKCTDRYHDGNSYERMEPTEDTTIEKTVIVPSVSTEDNI